MEILDELPDEGTHINHPNHEKFAAPFDKTIIYSEAVRGCDGGPIRSHLLCCYATIWSYGATPHRGLLLLCLALLLHSHASPEHHFPSIGTLVTRVTWRGL